MRTLLMGKRHGKDNWQIISGPESTTTDQIVIRDDINKQHPVNDTWSQVELWMEYPLKGRLKFVTSSQHSENKVSQKKSDEDAVNSRALAEERESDKAYYLKEASNKKHADEVAEINKRNDAHRAVFPVSKKAEKIIAEAASESDETPESARQIN